jgi:uncharacterized protein (DUF342 family)
VNDALITTDVLSFKLNDDGKLLASFEAHECKPPLDEEMLKEALAKQGLLDLLFYEGSFSNLIKQYNSSNDRFELEIGERRNGEFTLKIDPDRMAARLTLTPPTHGGTPVNLFQIQLALQEKGVIRGILTNEIKAVLLKGSASDLIIAHGLAPVRGTDARFQSLVPEIRERKPHIDKRGIVDYRDLGELIVVKKGDPLMCRTPPTPGKKGQDITGQILMPQPGLDTPFASGLQGVELDAEAELDPDHNSLLLAAITGQPKLVPNGVIVEPTISMPLVDISTGNVHFDGTINIKGDVNDGMKVYATGDVFIGGTVEAADVEADGNIVIKGGVIGHGEHSANPNDTFVSSAKIISKGSISARFAENAYLEAGTDIILEEFSMNNHLTSLNRILVGKSGKKKGRIIGGITSASILIKTAIIGADSGFITKVKAGFNPHLQAKMDKLKLEIEETEKKMQDIKKLISFFMTYPEKDKNGMLNKALYNRDKLEIDSARLHADRTYLVSEMTLPENVQIIVEETVHCGAEIQIGNAVWKNAIQRGKGAFQIIEGNIEFGNIMLSVT